MDSPYSLPMTSITLPKYLMVGIEIEFCTPEALSSACISELTSLGWKIGTDGSLAPRELARMNEISSRIFRDEFSAETVTRTCAALKREKAFVTHCCGIHVHFSFTVPLKITSDRRGLFVLDLQEKLSKFKPWAARLEYCRPYKTARDFYGFGDSKYRVIRYCGEVSARYSHQLRGAIPLDTASPEYNERRKELSLARELHFEARVFNSTLKPRGIMVAVDAVVKAANFVYNAESCGRYSDGAAALIEFC